MPGVVTQAATSLSRAVMPGHVRFRGMPNARWWEFETTETDFGGIQPEKRDLAKLIELDRLRDERERACGKAPLTPMPTWISRTCSTSGHGIRMLVRLGVPSPEGMTTIT